MIKLKVGDDWEELWKDGECILSGHKLDAEDVLYALGYRFEIEEIESEEE